MLKLRTPETLKPLNPRLRQRSPTVAVIAALEHREGGKTRQETCIHHVLGSRAWNLKARVEGLGITFGLCLGATAPGMTINFA